VSAEDLYHAELVRLAREGFGGGHLDAPAGVATLDSPLCGDRVTVYLKVKDGIVEDVTFEGRGCAISMASASMMTEVLKGKSEAEVRELFDRFHDSMIGKSTCHGADVGALDKLMVLSGVREYPMRVKCATLSWHTLMAALDHKQTAISTEGA